MPRFVRYSSSSGPAYGLVDAQGVIAIEGHPFGDWRSTGTSVDMEGLRLLAPVIPTKVVCVGRNFRDHAAELGGEVPSTPLLFLKPTSAIIGPADPIMIPSDLTDEVHHEAEVAVVVGRTLSRATPDQAARAVLGVTAANDVTARDLQRAEPQWTRAKGFDTFLPLGPALATEVDPDDLGVRCRVNGHLRQDGSTSDLVVSVAELLAFISHTMTLLPTDVVLTGTPAGVGPIAPGDVVDVEVDGVGNLVNPVVGRQD